jgi:hypothetical protein
MGGLGLFINALRNVKAILLLFIALKYIFNRNYIKYFLMSLLALSFHVSSIVMFPLYFIINKKYSKRGLFFILLGSLFFFVFGNRIFLQIVEIIFPFLPGRLPALVENYILAESAFSISRGLSLGLIEKLFTYFFVFYFYEKLCDKKMTLIVNCFIMYFMFYFAFSSFFEVSHRLSLFFSFSYWILWPQLLTCFRSKQMKQVFLLCLLVYSILKMSLYSQPVQQYDNILIGGHLRYQGRYNTLKEM